ncbi:MAG: hypothetical protein KF869_02235 [Phycisphaeraceae bacterium]|nr:hypothetical protein [Phycisphaeraceae bacterium]
MSDHVGSADGAGGGDGRRACRSCCGCGSSAGKLAALTFFAWMIQVPMLMLAVPRFVAHLADLGVALPVVTLAVIDWSAWMRQELFATKLTGGVVFAACVFGLAGVAYVLAKAGGGFGRVLVVLIALTGGVLACGQAASVIVPMVQAQRALNTAAP